MSKSIRILLVILVVALSLCACSKTEPVLEASTTTPIVIVVTATSPPTAEPTNEPTPTLEPTAEPTPTPAATDTPIPLATITPTPESTPEPTPCATIFLPKVTLVTHFVIVTPVPTAQFTPGELIDTFELDDSVFNRITPSLILEVGDYEILGNSQSTKMLGFIRSANEAEIKLDKVTWVEDSNADGGYRIVNNSTITILYPIDPNCELWFTAGSSLHYRAPIADLPPYIENWGDDVIWDVYIEDGKVTMLVEKYMP